MVTAVRWTAWQIPGWREDERLRTFYKNAFHPELINDIDGWKGGATDGSEHARRLRASLEYLLEQQPADVGTWQSMTRYAFHSEGELYGYLLALYEFFYGDRREPPVAPD
ncbi:MULTISPECIES: hypothetical protein [unclassified Streptomyces]|uniref:hypothetical protein n=1 Tax=unclassified Streptomyces TaxID=2593676 RepID=UPI00039C9597|nr:MULTISPECIES: hypothetical protein [unclassified Streptomyces]MYT30818.1 hypothetical protein [Streptomyces sp. SID8354]